MATFTVLPLGDEDFRIWARLMHRQSDTLFEDALIAATAKGHGLIVVTGNVGDFARFGVPLLKPFESRGARGAALDVRIRYGPHLSDWPIDG